MNYIAGLFAFLISYASAFYSASIDVSNKTVGVNANYTFTLALTSTYNSIPAGFRIDIIFPNTLILQGSIGSLPSYCTILDATEIVITTLYDPSNQSSGQTDSDYDGQCAVTGSNKITLINAKYTEMMLTFKIGLVTNPNISYTSPNMGNVQLYGYSVGSSVSDYYISVPFANKYFSASSLKSVQVSQDNLNVAGWSTYTLTLTTGKDIPSNGLISIVFKSDSVLKSQAETSATGTVNNGNTLVLGVSMNGQTVTLTGLFQSQALSNSTIKITIGQIKNPRFVGSTVPTVNTFTSNTEPIETGTFTIISSNPCQITFNTYIPQSYNVLATSNNAIYFGTDIFDASDTNQFQFYLRILFPTTFTILNTSSCNTAGGITNSPVISCTVNYNEFRSTIVAQTGSMVGVRFLNIINPPNNKTTDYIKLYLYTPSDVLICQNEKLFNFTAVPNNLLLVSKSRNSNIVADPGPYVLNFTTSTQMPAGAIIKVVIPWDQIVENTEIQCFQNSSSVNICSKVQNPIDPKTVELIMTEWCSASDKTCSSCCSQGTNLQITITGVRNPMFINQGVNSNIRIYTYNYDMTGVIDMITTGGQFQPSLTYRNVSGTISRSGDTVQLDSILSFSFTSATDYIASSILQLFLPTSLIYQGSSLNCSMLGNPVQCSSSLNSDNSIKTITFSICSSLCSANTYFSFSIIGLKNPLTTMNVSGSFTFTVLYSGYTIEKGQLTSTLNPLQPNIISSFIVARSSNIVSAYTTVSLLMQISSRVPAGGELGIKLPSNLLLTDSLIKVYKGTRQLQYSGNLTDMKIIDYCDTDCAAGITLNLTFTGTKNPDSVISITGIISATSKYSGTIDTGSTDISTILSPLLSGKIYNPEIHPMDPTVSVTTDYRIIFTPEHNIPSGAYIEISFPAGPQFLTPSCESYINIEPTLTCSKTSNILFVRNGFSSSFKGSFMIGMFLEAVVNPGSPISYSGFKVTLKDSNGFVIDTSSTFSVTFYSPAVSCACSKCSGTVCFECIIPGNYPFLSDYGCTQTCTEGRFLTTTQPYTCLKCHYTCATCNSYSASSCLTCANGFYKSDGYCISSCPSGTTLIGNDCSSLVPCSLPCATCSTSQSYCLSCAAGYKYTPGTGECESQCNDGYYWNGTVCVGCKYNCGTCSSSQICNSCLSYYPEQLLNNGVCVSQCPSGITVVKGSNCIPCDSTCDTCSDTTSNTCLTCTGNRYLHQSTCYLICPNNYYRSTGNLCIQSCPQGYYITSDSLDCLSCDTTCNTCSDFDSCTTCSGDLYLFNNTCSASCPNNYLKFTNNICIPSDDCTIGYYKDSEFCSSCPGECFECTSNSTCSNCSENYFLFQDFCYASCPSGYLKRQGNCMKAEDCIGQLYINQDTCLDCDQSCATCSGSTNSTCITCDGQLYLYLNSCVADCPDGYNKNSNNTCMSVCPTGKYSYLGTCQSCSLGCSVCKDENYCQQCDYLKYLTSDNQCVDVCPTGYYGNNGVCSLICTDSDCLKCKQSDSNMCLKCGNGTFLLNGLCVNYCPTGYYEDINTCSPCETGCINCLSKDFCEKCESNFSLYQGVCKSNCPDQYFNYNGICESCEKNCASCNSFHSCQECDSTTVLYKNKCVETCPEGYIESNKNCEFQCPNNCSECSNEKCTGCNTGLLLNGTCHSTCPTSYFAESKTCKKCPNLCESCNSLKTCTECKPSTYFYEDYCYSECPQNTTAVNGTCELICPNNCQECDKHGCTKCEPLFGMHSGICQTCPSGTYLYEGNCENCSLNCSVCSSSINCQLCISGFLYNGECLSSCPSGYSGTKGECKKNGQKSETKSYMVYPLVVEFFIILLVLLAAKFVKSDSYLIVPCGLALFSFLIFSCKVFLLGALWATGDAYAGFLVSLLTALIFGTGSLGVIFLYMNIEPLVYQSSTVEYYSSVHSKAFRTIKILSLFCGCQVFRIIYSGMFGLALTTESKSLAFSNRFRHPLEKMCQFNCFIVSLPLLILCTICLGVFEVISDVWQVALFTAFSTLLIEGYYIINYYRSYVFIN